MNIIETPLKGCFIVQPRIFKDDRGLFLESFNQKTFHNKTGLNIDFVQDNHSFSQKNVLRGLHYQKGDAWQAKLVRVSQGKVQDVVVDCRKDSPTYGKHFSIVLDALKHQQLFVPKGFLHGFLVLEDDTIFNYKCDGFYVPEADAGIMYNDSELNIDWLVSEKTIQLSEKDKVHPLFKEVF